MRHFHEITAESRRLDLAAPDASASDRRRMPRLAVYERIRITADGADWFTGSVTDCSDTGLGIYSARRLNAGDHILVSWKAGYFAGQVRHCVPAGDVWRAGIELEPLNAHRVLMIDLKGSRLA